MSAKVWMQCQECGLLQQVPPLPSGASARCARCGCTLRRHRPNSLDRTLALTLAGTVLFVIANSFPFLSFQLQGQWTESTLMTGVKGLYGEGFWELAVVVLFTTVLAPGLQLILLLSVLLPLRWNRLPKHFATLFRWVHRLTPWGMMDVFLLGILVSVVKLSDMATLVPGSALFAFVALIFVLAGAQSALDPHLVWSQVPLSRKIPPINPKAPVLSCAVCSLVVPAPQPKGALHCPRCGSTLYHRKPESLQRTWALLIAAILCYLPANLLPIMQVTSFGRIQSDTIFSGVVFLLHHDMWPLALIVFTASIFVPLLKLLILIFLVLSVQMRSSKHLRDRTHLYRITESIGRWSMVDIYVVTILVALVRLGNLATIEARSGALFFALVVILTLFAAMSFDPRLMWDVGKRV